MKLIIFWWVAVILDWYSTIIQSPTAEENPVVRYIWERSGDIGLTIFDLFIGLLVSYIIQRSSKLKGYGIICVAFSFVIVFKILMGLTNLNLIPYEVLGWFNY